MNADAKFRRNKDERNKSTSFVLHKGATSREQGNSDRRSVRMFEERLACEQNCDWASGTRDAQKCFCQCIIDTAKTNDIYLYSEECHNLGERILIRSGESQIYENASQGLIYKVRDPFAKIHLKSKDIRNIIYEHVIHNLLFPDTRYTFVGISEIQDSIRFVYSQELVFGLNKPTQQQIDEHLASIGLWPESKYYYENDFVAVTDVDANGDNVLLDSNNNLLFIDPIIKIKQPIDKIISAYPFVEMAPQSNLGSLTSFLKRIFNH